MTIMFKNNLIYRLRKPIDIEALTQNIEEHRFTGCTPLNFSKSGFIPVLNEMLVYQANGQVLLCIQREEKLLPTQVIKRAWHDKIEKLENAQQRKLKKTEKDSLKDEVIHELLPQAFSNFSQTYLWIDTINNFITIDAGSSKRAEDSLALLRKTLGSLPVVPLQLENPIELTLTEWIRSGKLPSGFSLQDEAELKALAEGGTIRCKGQELLSDEINAHIEAGKHVTKLSLDWRERISFTLNDDCQLLKIVFSEVLKGQNADIDTDDYAQRLDADFCLFTGELIQLRNDLINALGGERCN